MKLGKAAKRIVFAILTVLFACQLYPARQTSAAGDAAVRRMDESEKAVYLTFDDGPDAKNTVNVMETLIKHNAQATFFFTGRNMHNYPSVVKQIYDNGFTIGLHGYNHGSLAKMSEPAMRKDIADTNNILEGITGERTAILRPPYGALNAAANKTIQSLGFTAYIWTIDPRDWQKHLSDSQVMQIIKTNLKPGAIILLHASGSHPRASEMLPDIIEYIKSEGYELKALPDPGIKTSPAQRANVLVSLKNASISVSAYSINSGVYVKIRDFAAALNGTKKQFEMRWNDYKRTIEIYGNKPYSGSAGAELSSAAARQRAKPSDTTVTVNGKEAGISVYTINGSSYLNAPELADALGISYLAGAEKSVFDAR